MFKVPEIMCKMLGFQFGRKLTNLNLADESTAEDRIYVLDRIQCQGDEMSIFECDLGMWLLG
jgi:NAD-dependent dihydropyrimidine dehydrogenase PreA subunit